MSQTTTAAVTMHLRVPLHYSKGFGATTLQEMRDWIEQNCYEIAILDGVEGGRAAEAVAPQTDNVDVLVASMGHIDQRVDMVVLIDGHPYNVCMDAEPCRGDTVYHWRVTAMGTSLDALTELALHIRDIQYGIAQQEGR